MPNNPRHIPNPAGPEEPKRKPGRPPKAESDKLTERLQVWMTKRERQTIEAERGDLSAAEYLRSRIGTRLRRKP